METSGNNVIKSCQFERERNKERKSPHPPIILRPSSGLFVLGAIHSITIAEVAIAPPPQHLVFYVFHSFIIYLFIKFMKKE